MPILVGPNVIRVPSTAPPPVAHDDVGTMAATYIDPSGIAWPLTNTDPSIGWFTRPEVAGWGARPYEIVTDPDPRGGDTIRFIRAQAGHLTWPLHVYGDTHMEFVTRLRQIRKAFTMTVHRGQTGLLRVARPDGTYREVDVMYSDGFGGEPGEDWLFANPTLTLMCPDGYWRSNPSFVTRKYLTRQPFLSPYPRISSSQVIGITTIKNPGDVAAWPTWLIAGPMEAMTAVSNTTGRQFTITYSLAAGETATITTQRPTVRGPAGQNIADAINWPVAFLWPLLDGDNDIEIDVEGADSGTSVTLSFSPRFEGA